MHHIHSLGKIDTKWVSLGKLYVSITVIDTVTDLTVWRGAS